jgi:IS5 family transposase
VEILKNLALAQETKQMYRMKEQQTDMFEDATLFGGVRLDPRNKWVRMAKLVPWETFEERYAASFANPRVGNPAKPARMAVASLIIQKRYGFSDRDTGEEIRENPYLQYFLGFPAYSYALPFDPSMMTWFRERVTPEMLAEVNDCVIGRKTDDAKDEDEVLPASGEGADGGSEEKHEGTLILDATCCPQNIRFPTDVSLLNEGRELLEKMIDTAHDAGATEGKKPRTYRDLARRDWLRYAKDRKSGKKKLRKAIRQQLGYIRRDLGYLEAILAKHPDALNGKLLEQYAVIQTLYAQQQEMFRKGTRRTENRIVSIHQPWVRPIVRGKTAAPTEFGAKVELSMNNGYARVEEIRWDAYNEGTTLKASVERYREDMGKYPERILADKIFRNRGNLSWCREKGIRLNGPRLGRPPKNREQYLEERKLERQESGERNEIEGCIGVCKSRYGLDLVTTRLKHTSEVAIHAAILTRNLFKRVRALFRLLFCRVQRVLESWFSDKFSLSESLCA